MYNNYLVHYNHNHDRLGRFARSTGAAAASVGGKITRKNKKTAPPAADIKKGKSANTKLSASERERIVNSGNAKEVSKYKDRLSTRELEVAVTRLQKEKIQRIDLEKKLSDLNPDEQAKKREAVLDKIDRYSTNLERLATAGEKVAKAYNVAAKTHNAIAKADDQWPLYGDKKTKEDKKEEHQTSSKIQKVIDSGNIKEVMKYKKSMTKSEIGKALNKVKAYDALADYEYERAKSNYKRANETRELRDKKADYEYEREKLANKRAGEERDQAIKDYEAEKTRSQKEKAIAEEKRINSIPVDVYDSNVEDAQIFENGSWWTYDENGRRRKVK